MVDFSASYADEGSPGFAPSPRPAALTLTPEGLTKDGIQVPQNFHTHAEPGSHHNPLAFRHGDDIMARNGRRVQRIASQVSGLIEVQAER